MIKIIALIILLLAPAISAGTHKPRAPLPKVDVSMYIKRGCSVRSCMP